MSEEVSGLGAADKRWAKARIAAHIEARRIRVEALELQGIPVRRIAEAVQVDVHTAHDDLRAIRKARRELVGESTVREQRDLELHRLEQQRVDILRDMTARPATENTEAVPAKLTRWQGHRLLLQVAARKATLMGLDVPQRVQLAEYAPGDQGVEDLEEQTGPRTLRDMLAGVDGIDSPAELARVIHMSRKQAG